MKRIIIALLVLSSFNSFAQCRSWDFGFNLGVNTSQVELPSTTVSIENYFDNYGFQLGLMADKQILPFVHFTPKAELAFNKAQVIASPVSSLVYKVMETSLNIAPHFRIEVEAGKRDPYLLFGPNLKIPLYTEKNTITTEYRNDYDVAFEVGLGYSRDRLFFDFSPEIRYSYGMRNINQNPQLESLYLHQIALVFNFY